MKNKTNISGRVTFESGNHYVYYYVAHGKPEFSGITGKWGHNMETSEKKRYQELCKKHHTQLKQELKKLNVYFDDIE